MGIINLQLELQVVWGFGSESSASVIDVRVLMLIPHEET